MNLLNRAKEILSSADAILITAGAGMGVDSGLPDFRGDNGFWREYPKAKELNLSFEQMANPKWFKEKPSLAWAFYGHRLNLYKKITPHKGFSKLVELSKSKKYGSFVFTSNVDGQFQQSGFSEDRVMECHGSIHHLQCVDRCCEEIWSAENIEIEIDNSFKAKGSLPKCIYCNQLARPNILMFDDFDWVYHRTDRQRDRLVKWVDNIKLKNGKLAVIEFGAGTAVPTVRNTSRQIATRFNTPLIRVNPRESFDGDIEIEMGALEAILKIID
jgi:NAD-dependent SIR2 family protein deacetylase